MCIKYKKATLHRAAFLSIISRQNLQELFPLPPECGLSLSHVEQGQRVGREEVVAQGVSLGIGTPGGFKFRGFRVGKDHAKTFDVPEHLPMLAVCDSGYFER